jgi:DNA-directed RNA polymerase subunit RPC12/RpoP
MKNLFDVAKTTPLPQTPQAVADVIVNFTPVDVPTHKPENLTGALLANFELPSAVIKATSMRCHACGKSSGNSDLFCVSCGELLETDEAKNLSQDTAAVGTPTCGDCGTEVSTDEVFCMSCGSVVAL